MVPDTRSSAIGQFLWLKAEQQNKHRLRVFAWRCAVFTTSASYPIVVTNSWLKYQSDLQVRRGLLVTILLLLHHLPWYLTEAALPLLFTRRRRPWYLMWYVRRRTTGFHLRPSIMYSRLLIIIMRAHVRLNRIISILAFRWSRISLRR